LNIAFFNQNALIQREVVTALRKFPGVHVIAIDIQTHPVAAQAQQVVSILGNHGCEMVITINEWGIDDSGIIWEYCDSHKIAHINWTVDDPFFEEIVHRKKYRPSKYRIDFVSDKGYLEPMRTQGYSVHFLPLATDLSLFHPPPDLSHPRDLDVVFVGNSYLKQIDSFLRMAPGFIDTLVPFLGEVVSSYLADVDFDVEGTIEEKLRKKKIPADLTYEKACFIAKHAAGYFGRKRMITSLAERFRGFMVYGDAGWKQDIPEHRLGTAKYYDSLCEVYQRARITIDINRMVIRNGFTQRVFDAPACGSLVITGKKQVVDESFTVDGEMRDVVVFDSLDTLHDAVNYYLLHDNERAAVAQRGMNTVFRRHTYDHRINEMFTMVKRSGV